MGRKATSQLGIIATAQDKASGTIVRLSSTVTGAGASVTRANASMAVSSEKLLGSIKRLGESSVSLRMLEKGWHLISGAVSGAIGYAEKWTKAAIASEGATS
ncbi:MAG: hypothetical protein RL139_893, partial [Gemmatimonadota bacterium]